MKYRIEFELPDNDTVIKNIEHADIYWRAWGYSGYTHIINSDPENDWISVTKKAHPDLPIRVQVQLNNGWIITAFYQDGEWISVPDCEDALQDEWIEAWRELPEPYKRDDNGQT